MGKYKRKSLYEPVHGSAPDIVKNIANPIAMILSFDVFELYFKIKKISELLDKAVENTLENGYRTKDIMQKNCNLLSTSEMGEVAKEFRNLLIKYENNIAIVGATGALEKNVRDFTFKEISLWETTLLASKKSENKIIKLNELSLQ